jgi:glycosyltransferase involved in cell wall biosynthesis
LAGQLSGACLAPYVNFAGWPVDYLPAYFAAANVAIFPYDDNLINRTKCSVKLLDLLLAELPVVADAVGQNCEYIQHNVSGVLVPPQDDAAFAEALVDLLQDPARQHRLGQAARQHIQERFNWTCLAQTVERAYQCAN